MAGRMFKIRVVAEAFLTEEELTDWQQKFTAKGVRHVMEGCGGTFPFMEERARPKDIEVSFEEWWGRIKD